MNKNKLTALCHKVAKESGLSFNTIQLYYFLERILCKIASSEDGDNFIFKGGFLLSSVLGIRKRHTVDIDCIIRGFILDRNVLQDKFSKIFATSDEDITYQIKNIEEIREV